MSRLSRGAAQGVSLRKDDSLARYQPRNGTNSSTARVARSRRRNRELLQKNSKNGSPTLTALVHRHALSLAALERSAIYSFPDETLLRIETKSPQDKHVDEAGENHSGKLGPHSLEGDELPQE